MKECASFTYQFETIEQAEKAANLIKEWAKNNLSSCDWVNQLFPVTKNYLFVGNNTPVDWFDYDGKISRLADNIHKEYPDFIFSGKQDFCNMVTGFEVAEIFLCDGETVKYSVIEKCSYCACNIDNDDYFELNDLSFCNEDCAKSYLIDILLEEDDFDEDELDEKSCEELLELLSEYE